MNFEQMSIDAPRSGEYLQAVRAWVHQAALDVFVLHVEF